MGQGTITLPSGDKLITQTETIAGGALVHREEIVVAGTISDQFAVPTNAQPSPSSWGLPVWIVKMPTQTVDAAIYAMNAALSNSAAIGASVNDTSPTRVNEGNVGALRMTPLRDLHANLRDSSGNEIGSAGTPLQVSLPTGAQPVSIAGTVAVAFTPAATQAISTVAGTVSVSFVPSAIQNVNLLNVGFAGTPLRIDPTGTTTQPVSFAGTVSIADSARYSEQLTQSSRLTTIDTDVQAITAAVLGTPAVKFASAQQVSISGVPSVSIPGTPAVSIFGTPSVAISTLPPVTFAAAQPISTVAGTVSVTFPSAQSVSISGVPSVSVPGTPAVTVFGTPSVNVASHPSVTFTTAQPISTVAGTVAVTFPSAQSVTVAGLPTVSIPGTPSVVFSSAQPISSVAGTVAVNVRNNIFTIKSAKIDLGASGNGTIVNAVTSPGNRRIKVFALNFNTNYAGSASLAWLDGSSSLSGTQTFIDREGLTMSTAPPAYLFAPQAGTPLVAHVPTALFAGGIRGFLSYFDDDAT